MGKEKDIILSFEIEKHPDRDYTWELCDYEIEDKIKELRKQIYHLQNCRKKQPKLLVFRNLNFSKDKSEKAHIFHGFKSKDKLLCADYWTPITQREADYVRKKYKMREEYLKIIDDTTSNHGGKS